MDELEVVIRSPEEWMEQFKAFKHPSTLETVILQGTVLPKVHGRLIDADTLWDSFQDSNGDFYEALDDTPTLLEAKEEE